MNAALDEAAAGRRVAHEQAERAREGLTREAAEVRRKLARYLAAFDAGELDAQLVQSRVTELQAQLAAIEARLAETPAAEPGPAGGPTEAALVSWALSQALDKVLQQGQRARTKALLRFLTGEIRVASPTDIRPTCRAPANVRIPGELVGEVRFERTTCRV